MNEEIKNDKPLPTPTFDTLVGSIPNQDFLKYDMELGSSYRRSLSIAYDVLAELSKEQQKTLMEKLLNVMWQWKDEHGVYPPRPSGILGLGGLVSEQSQEKVSAYEQKMRLVAALEDREFSLLIWPWDCDDFAKTPYKLFNKLFAEGYEPLKILMKEDKIGQYYYILAGVIVLTYNSESKSQSKDCIEATIELAEFRLKNQKSFISSTEPYVAQAFNRKRAQKQSSIAQKEETERKVMELHYSYEANGEDNMLEHYHYDLLQLHGKESRGFSVPNISKILKENGITKYKSK